MGRSEVRTTTLSLDTVAIIRRLYPRVQSFWERHLRDTEITIQYFYGAMRGDKISTDAEQLIDSNIDYDLRQLEVDRDFLAMIPEFNEASLVPEMLEFMERITRGQDLMDELDRFRLLVKLRIMAFILKGSDELGR